MKCAPGSTRRKGRLIAPDVGEEEDSLLERGGSPPSLREGRKSGGSLYFEEGVLQIAKPIQSNPDPIKKTASRMPDSLLPVESATPEGGGHAIWSCLFEVAGNYVPPPLA